VVQRFAPGTSPFHVKGHVWQGALEYYSGRVPGGLVALTSKLDPDLRTFVGQRFLAASWYDALPIATVSLAVARLCGVEQEEILRDRSRWQAERDIRGIYRMLVRLVSPETVATRFGRVILQYFDFGKSDAKIISPGVCEIIEDGIPLPLALCMVPIAEGWAETALRQAGALDVQVRAEPPHREGERSGMDTYRLRFEVSWK
jgi:hypothetical protein